MSVGLVFSVISAAAQMQAGQAAYEESLLNSFRIKEVDKKLQKVEAMNASLVRQQEAATLEKANIAALSATRELSGPTVARILERDREALGDTLKGIARMSLLKSLQSDAEAYAEVRRGRNERAAATVGALGTVAKGIQNSSKTKVG